MVQIGARLEIREELTTPKARFESRHDLDLIPRRREPGDVPVRRVATKLIYPLATWRLLNGKKIFASLSEAATHYGILCTEEKPQLSRADAIYVAVPAQSEGFGFAMPAVGR